MKAGFKVNNSFFDKLQMMQDDIAEDAKEHTYQVAERAINNSVPFVDTGAYITSFSVKDSYSSGRGRTSHGKPRNQDPEAKRQESLMQIQGDIEAIDFMNAERVVISNGAPHASEVEKNHGIFEMIRQDFKQYGR